MSPEPCPQALGTALPCSSTPLQPLFVLPSWQVLCLPPPAPGFLPQAPAQAVLWLFPCPVLSCSPWTFLSPPFLPAPAGTTRTQRGHPEASLQVSSLSMLIQQSQQQYFLPHSQELLSLPASWTAPTPWQRAASNKHLNRKITNVHEVQGDSIHWKMYS